MKFEDKSTKVKVLYTLLTEMEKLGCFEIKTKPKYRRKIAELIANTSKNYLENELLNKTLDVDMGEDFYDAACERLAALKSYKLIYKRNKSFRLTRRGVEFLKHEDKEFYIGKIILSDKYKRTKHPDVFLECLKVYVSLSKKDRNSIM